MRKVLKIISSEFYVFINWCVAEMRANELHPQADSEHGDGHRGTPVAKVGYSRILMLISEMPVVLIHIWPETEPFD